MPHNRGTRRKPNYVGAASVAGWTAGGTLTRRKHAGLNVHVNMS
jgi:hypothetical protein